MPIYEYACGKCQHRFEQRRSMGRADDPTTCPRCESDDIQRLMSKVVCFSKGEGGQVASVGGGGCASCSSGSCASCHS